jgi:hypothetical protein
MSPSRRRKNNGNGNARRTARSAGGRDFWGQEPDDEVDLIARPPADPFALIRSLGPPPLPGRENLAEQYFALVYDKAASLAIALAAASDLLPPDDDD